MKNNLMKIRDISNRFRNLTTLGIASLAANAISGLFWLYIARLLGTSNYGEVSYLLALSGIGVVFSFLGAGNTLTVYTAKELKIQPAIYFMTLVGSGVAALVLFVMFKNFGVSLYVIGNVVFGLVTAELLGKKSFKKYSIYLITQKIFATIFAIILYYLIGINGVILGLALSFFPYSFAIYRGLRISKIDFSIIRTKFGFIVNSYILDLARTFSTTTDKLIVAPMLGYALLGNYQLGVQVLSILGILPAVTYYYILPHDSSGKPNNRLKKATIFGSVILASLGILLAPVILPTLFPKFKEAVEVVQIMSLSIIFATINNMYISKFLGIEKSKIVLIGSGIYLVSQISLILLLGKVFGVNGVAASAVLATMAESTYLISVNRFFNKKNAHVENTETKKDQVLQEIDRHDIQLVPKESIFTPKKIILFLTTVGLVSLALRLYYFPYKIPLILDALNDYFFNATDLSVLGHVTDKTLGAHGGWTVFLSFFFTIFRLDNLIAFMTLQREITIGLSVLTIIPIYFLCKRFVDRPYAMAGAAIFAFDPRIIQNSLLGIAEPLYIIIITSSFVLYFSTRRKLVYASFALVGLSSMVRPEGLFVFLPMIIMFYIRNRKERKIILKVILGISIFILLLLPIALFRISNNGNDGFTSRILQGTNQVVTTSNDIGMSAVLKTSTENILKLGGWSLFPIFIILLPIGLYFCIKEKDTEKRIVLIIMIFMLLPVIYALAFNPDTRFMYPLFPLFSIVSAFSIKKIIRKSMHKDLLLVFIIGIILFASAAFLEIKKFDYEHQGEAYSIASEVIKIANGVNTYYPEDSFITPAELPEKWPTLKSSINFKTVIIPTDGFDSLTEYIKSSEKNGLTHLVIDDQKNRPAFLNDVFYNKEKYPYLMEVYDSSEHGFKYHVKIFKIDYNIFYSIVH